ncbi:Uncharacterised protein [Mycobacteroides abscessus subsp. abscessus]|nr:Uncharacterised protein [Mycobacteroides abscessus subsp. abscessus]
MVMFLVMVMQIKTFTICSQILLLVWNGKTKKNLLMKKRSKAFQVALVQVCHVSMMDHYCSLNT